MTPSPSSTANKRLLRAQRILDAAAQLLERWGYSRVTIDDIARHAGIGKGTIYLHWPNQEALFMAVLQRELLQFINDLAPTLGNNPEELLLHRLVRHFWLAAHRRPLIRAVFVQDLETLGRLTTAGDPAFIAQQYEAFEAYVELLKQSRLLRADITAREVMYVYRATITGFFLAENLIPADYQPDAERKADLLAVTFQRTFEIPDPPPRAAIKAIAPEIVKIIQRIAEAKKAMVEGGVSSK
ncbi:MAG: TetR/AcrR family transcriptional regulator, partial [Verrucomicrobia bacterium]|nr:TetR/AcrR family transcriptional regulator [Verrucomicrobiota bacterium]